MAEKKDLKEILNGQAFMEKFTRLLDEKKAVQEIGFALMAVAGNDKLQQCSQESILSAVYSIALTGLTLNPVLKFAALVPRYSGGKYYASLMPMYQGLVQLLTDSGSVSHIATTVVYEGDDFKVEYGSEPKIIHVPKFKTKDNIAHAYSIATLHNGEKMFEVMTWAEIEKARDASETWKAYKAGKVDEKFVIWLSWPGEMARKTVLRRLIKYLPKTDRYEQLAQALNLDEADYAPSMQAIGYAEALLRTSTYDDEGRELIEAKLGDCTAGELTNIINDLKENQIQKQQKQIK